MADARKVTRLEWFLRTHDLKPAHVAPEALISRQHLLRLRQGKVEPSRKIMLLLQRACSRLTKKKVRVADLFDLEGGE
jgi:hypothetical protein